VHIKKLFVSALGGAAMIGAGLSASATSLIHLDLKGLIDQSAIVVVAEVTEQHSAETAQGLYTMTTFSVDDTVVGSNGATVTVAVPGGIFNKGKFKLAETWPGAPVFLNGQEMLLFLSDAASDGNYRVVGFSQGSLNVLDTIEGKMVELPGDNLGPVRLEDAKTRIREMRNGSRGNTKSLE